MAVVSGALSCAGQAGDAWAQSRMVDDIIVEQSRIIERFSPPPVRGSATLRAPAFVDRLPAELAAIDRFVLRSVRVDGATELPPAAFRPLWQDLVGREIPVAALVELATGIERRYREAGILALAVVPMQNLADGDVRIAIFDQSFIETVETGGDAPRLRARLEPYIRRLVAMQPLRLGPIERELLLMSDIAGMNLEATLRRPEQPGNGGALVLDIAFEPRVVRLALDNRGSAEVGPLQAVASFQENDLLGLLESTAVTAVTIPNQPRELVFGQLAQDAPVGHAGLHVGYRVDAARSQPGGDLSDLDVDVTSYTGEVYAAYPVLRRIGHSLWARTGVTARNADVDVAGQAQARDRYRWLSAGIESEHATAIGPLALQFEFLQGIDALGATEAGSTLASRDTADPRFQAVTAGIELAVELSERTGVTGRAAAQHAFDPLPAEVQMAFGGEPFGRAFDSGTIAGDSGVAGAIELAVATDIPSDIVRTSAVYGFVDYAALWFRGDDRTDSRATLGSAGAGFRAVLDGGVALDTSLALPVETEEAAEDSGLRLFVSLKMRF